MSKRYQQPILPELPDSPKMSNVLTEEIKTAYISNLKQGYVEEDYNVVFIKRYLLTSYQLEVLTREVLSIEDFLNGRFPVSDWGMVDTVFFVEWNAKLGEQCFRA